MADLPKAIRNSGILHLAALIKYLPGLRNRGLLGNDPGVQRAAYVTKTVECVHGAHAAARNTDEPHHLAFELIEAHQVESVLQHATYAAMIFRSCQNDPVGA